MRFLGRNHSLGLLIKLVVVTLLLIGADEADARSSGALPQGCKIWTRDAENSPEIIASAFTPITGLQAVYACYEDYEVVSLDALIGPRVTSGMIYYTLQPIDELFAINGDDEPNLTLPPTLSFTTVERLVFPSLAVGIPPDRLSDYFEISDIPDTMLAQVIQVWKDFRPADHALSGDLSFQAIGLEGLGAIVGAPSPNDLAGMTIYVTTQGGEEWGISFKFEEGVFVFDFASPRGI